MNALSPAAAATVRESDLASSGECRGIESYLADRPDSSLFHLPAWSRTAERGCGQRSRYLVAEQGGRIVGCLPLTEVRSLLFGRALVSAGFGTGGGIVADNDFARAALAEAGWALAERLGCGSVELRGGVVPAGWTASTGAYAAFARDLPTDAATLLAAIPKRQRAEVRRARDFGLDLSIGRDSRHVADHFRVYAESVRNLGTPVFPRRLFEAALAEFGEAAEILQLHREGRPLATMLTFRFRDTIQPYWGGGTAEARKWRANDLLYFETMRRGVELGCTRADFGRSKVGTGPHARKRIWDFAETPLVYGVRTADGAKPREVNPLDPKYRLQVAAWQRLPLAVANRLGPMIARGLG